MKKFKLSVVIAVLAVSPLFGATEVSSWDSLKSAVKNGETDILVTSSIDRGDGLTLSSDSITIPSGTRVTLTDGVVIKLRYRDRKLWKATDKIICNGVIVTGTKKIVTKEVRTLPVIGSKLNRFSGATYEVTKVESTGGSIVPDDPSLFSGTCASSVSVDGGKTWNETATAAAAVVCEVTSGINGGRKYVNAYSSFEEAYNAAKFGTQTEMPTVMNGKVVVLLSGGTFSLNAKIINTAVVVDCAGFSGEIASGGYGTLNLTKGEFASSSFCTFINASVAKAPKLTNSGAAFINCNSAVIDEVNSNTLEQSHFYDCGTGTMTIGSYPSGEKAGAYFYSGGPYNVSFPANCHIYGGSFKNDPTEHLEEDLEAEKNDSGVWTVQPKAPTVYLAKIGEIEYESLSAAISAATSSDTVTLLGDITLSSPIEVAEGKKVTIELAGKNIVAEKGAFVNRGELKLEYSYHYSVGSTMSSASGNLIENYGTVEITYGDYVGDILLAGGEIIVHNGTFDCSFKVVDGVDPKKVADLRGGAYKNSVAPFLREGFIETAFENYLHVGAVPSVYAAKTLLGSAEAAWQITNPSDTDRELFVRWEIGQKRLRSDYTQAEWYRVAELRSMYKPYLNDVIDCVVKFNRAVKKDSIKVYATISGGVPSKLLDVDLAAGEEYRAFTTNLVLNGAKAFVDYLAYLTDDKYESLAIGLENLSDENAGTLCTVEFQICTSRKLQVQDVRHRLASVTYQFPWKDAIPELREDDSPETVVSALAGTADAKVAENIKDVAAYNSYRAWTAGVKGATAAEVKSAPNAWLSYALNTTNLVATPVAGDLKVDSITPLQNGAFALELSVKDIDIGMGNVDDATVQENLAKVFGIEGTTSLEDSAFSAQNVIYTFGTPVDGKVKVEAKNANAGTSGGCFFMRAKMNP